MADYDKTGLIIDFDEDEEFLSPGAVQPPFNTGVGLVSRPSFEAPVLAGDDPRPGSQAAVPPQQAPIRGPQSTQRGLTLEVEAKVKAGQL